MVNLPGSVEVVAGGRGSFGRAGLRGAGGRLGPGGPRAGADGGGHRQPERQDHGKRGDRGFDAHKRVTGRKRHLAVDTNGFLMLPYVTGAEVQDRDAADALLIDLKREQPTLLHVWADQGYAGALE